MNDRVQMNNHPKEFPYRLFFRGYWVLLKGDWNLSEQREDSWFVLERVIGTGALKDARYFLLKRGGIWRSSGLG